ncbi:MAG: hypothetical protein KBT44_00770, partial [Bacteroidales bacterium]|nr:hypothetical protein [Candidatus Equibacterium intestinale]
TWGGPVACEIIDNIYASSPEWAEAISSEGAMPKIAERPCPTQTDSTGRVPDVRGMGLRDATYLLESQGFKVKSSGCGKIQDIKIEEDCVILSLAEKL